MSWLYFAIGLVVGANAGVLLMALLAIAKEENTDAVAHRDAGDRLPRDRGPIS